MAEETLKAKTSKGLFWGGTSSFIQQLLNAIFGIYLARTLSPGDYGLVGMLAIFSMLANLFLDGNFGAALINKKEIHHDDYNAVFWFNIIASFLCATALFFASPLIARYFHHQELIAISRWFAFGFILSGFGPAQRAYLTKRLKIKEISIVTIIAVFISGAMGVFLAWRGYAYWTLVIQSLVLNFLTNIGLWLFSDWRPSFKFTLRPVIEMSRFTIRLIAKNIFDIVGGNFITVILGRYYPVNRVGLYTQANKWNAMGTSVLSGMVNSVAHPILATVVEDKTRQVRVFRKMIRFAAFISFPAMLGLAFIAPEFILLALTDKWTESIPLLQILCIGSSVIPLINICAGLILSRGRSDLFLLSSIILFVLQILSVFFCYPLGITWMVIGISIVNILSIILWLLFVNKEIDYPFLVFIADILPFLGITLLSIAAVWFFTKGINNLAISLFCKILITAVVYIILMRVSSSVTYKECIHFFLDRNNHNA